MTLDNREHEHDDVYGKSFALYDTAKLTEFVGFFEQRVLANGLDAGALFKGRTCIDAGCGNGRGALFMLKNGATRVTALDISNENLKSVARNLTNFGFSNFDCQQTSLEEIPIADASVDFVWCNGVLMHTAKPDACLQELARVLKIGGQTWIYVYGSNGFYWYLVKHFRRIFAAVSSQTMLDCLQLAGLDVRYIGEYMDDWKVPYLRSYTNEDFASRLDQVGFGGVQRLWRGVPYDTSERLTKFPDDSPWLGEGDLRYLATKTAAVRHPLGSPLSESEYGSTPFFAQEIAEAFEEPLRRLDAAVGANKAVGIVVAANLQRRLRDMMTEDASFNHASFLEFARRNIEAVEVLTEAASRASE
jgi:ubiquinone/menaquinone biosynthesis C-methylase UbiE